MGDRPYELGKPSSGMLVILQVIEDSVNLLMLLCKDFL